MSAGARPTPCLLRALLDGVEERAGHLQQHPQTPLDELLGANIHALLPVIFRHNAIERSVKAGDDRARVRALLHDTVWRLLGTPHLVADYARPLCLPRALVEVSRASACSHGASEAKSYFLYPLHYPP